MLAELWQGVGRVIAFGLVCTLPAATHHYGDARCGWENTSTPPAEESLMQPQIPAAEETPYYGGRENEE